jgi:hypothetical protein
MSDYSYVIDSSFKPFSMQEMLVPFSLYKEAYDKTEEGYNALSDKADKFRYLADTLPEGSKARQIYEGYANDLTSNAESLANEGLTMANRRSLTSLKRRYAGEIGRLDMAQEKLEKIQNLRYTMDAQDPSMIYALDNLSIDDLLDGHTPNLYGVSGSKLYERGLQIGASDSSRIWSNPKVQQVNDYYQSLYQTNGRDPRILNAWRKDLQSIPELKESLDGTLKEFGATDNLKEANPIGYERATEAVINGIINGSTYKRADNFQRDLGKLTAAELEAKRESDRNYKLQLIQAGLKEDAKGNLVFDEDNPYMKKKTETKSSGKTEKSGGSGTAHETQMKKGIRIEWDGNPADDNKKVKYKSKDIEDGDQEHKGDLTNYDDLPKEAKDMVDKIIKDGRSDFYDIYYSPFKEGTFWNDNPILEVRPRDIQVDDAPDADALNSIFGE